MVRAGLNRCASPEKEYEGIIMSLLIFMWCPNLYALSKAFLFMIPDYGYNVGIYTIIAFETIVDFVCHCVVVVVWLEDNRKENRYGVI